jgi:hypothetical protein
MQTMQCIPLKRQPFFNNKTSIKKRETAGPSLVPFGFLVFVVHFEQLVPQKKIVQFQVTYMTPYIPNWNVWNMEFPKLT